MKVFNVSVLILVFAHFISGQESSHSSNFYNYKNQIGINFTNVLGNVLSLNPNNASSPYGITYRRHYKNWSLRSAFSFDYNKDVIDDFTGGSFIQRKINVLNTQCRLGVEKHLQLNHKLMFTYGFDVLGLLERENSDITDFLSGSFNTFLSQERTYGFGGGPVIRLEYKISERISLSTESSFYGFYSFTTESIFENGIKTSEPTKEKSSLLLELPQSLFFNISF